MSNMNNRGFVWETTEEIPLNDLISEMIKQLDYDEIEKFIAKLEKDCEDWGVTNNLIQHFKALELEIIEALKPGDYDLTPKKIEL